jgi:hypothetical protein
MALSSLPIIFIPTSPLMMAFGKMTTIHMEDMVKLEKSVSDYQPWRKSIFCIVDRGDVITLTPFLSAGWSLKL